MPQLNRATTVACLGTAQTLAWASSFYLPAMLAAPMARDLGVTTPTVFAAFSTALVVSGLIGPKAGRLIDRWGGRPVLMASNLVFALGLGLLGMAEGAASLFAAWLVIGLAMGSGLYEAAFAALVRLYGRDSRGLITGITLVAGFASTVGWPLTTLIEAQAGWRGACFAWAALHLVVGLPLNWLLPRAQVAVQAEPAASARADAVTLPAPPAPRWATPVLAFLFAATGFTGTVVAAHLPVLLQLSGASLAAAVAAGALIGPAQVAARLLEFSLLRHIPALWSARFAAMTHPVAVLVLMLVGAPAAAVFAIVHGAGNGMLTIAKGTLPLTLFGPVGYGERQGLLSAPARLTQALAPWLFGVLMDRYGLGAIWVSGVVGAAACGSLWLLSTPSAGEPGRSNARTR